MMSLLLLIAILGPSFDVAPEVCMEVQTLEQEMFYIKDAAAEIAEEAMWLEPVHNSPKWFEFSWACVESCLPLSEDTQDRPYFK